ncbi:hypothetical protein RchiOBHm_Chr1g0371071 [Rosa chinensis]|uniref:Uncharacterized protein n=1 Tax=Rosa chinensis TaxID=74649 RepID=A0A2P6SLE5_ROSCH|nr:hypothetical protein RchiOBHm_Chr1g0371071 [Rosa chinensis]
MFRSGFFGSVSQSFWSSSVKSNGHLCSASFDHIGGQVEVNGEAGGGVEPGRTRVGLWCYRFPTICDDGRKAKMASAVAGSRRRLAGIGLAALVTAVARCREDLKKPAANPSFELGLTLTGLLWASGPEFLGTAFNGPLLMTGPVCEGLTFREGLQTFKNSLRSNLFPRLLATEEAEDGNKASCMDGKLIWEDHSRKAAISISGSPCPAVHVLGKSTVAECTDTPILGNAAESTRPKPLEMSHPSSSLVLANGGFSLLILSNHKTHKKPNSV